MLTRLVFIYISVQFLTVFTGLCQGPQFSPKGGVFQKAPQVVIKAPHNAKIYYTTDGSEPKQGDQFYSKPLSLRQNTVIRAVYYLEGKKSEIVTQSYFFEREYKLPVVSIAVNPGDLWDEEYGMLSYGCCYDTLPPFEGANFWKTREKRANIEFFDKETLDGKHKTALNQLAGIRTHGQYSLTWPQRSLAVLARSKYGESKFEYPIFPAKPHLKKYKSFLLRNSGGDFSNTHLRDAFMTQLVRNLAIDIQAYKPAIVFLNGQYWGVMNMREKINEHYLKYNHPEIHKDSVDLLKHRYEKQHGTSKNYRKFIAYVEKTDFSDDENYKKLGEKMDITNYLIYNIAETYSDNRDAGGNIRYYKSYRDTAKWRWIFYDLDMGLGINKNNSYKHNTVKRFTSVNHELWPNPPWSTLIIRRILENKQGQEEYINLFADYLNTVFHPDTAARLLNQMAQVIEPEMPYHLKKWDRSFKAWKQNIRHLEEFVLNRPTYLRKFIMEKFEIKDTISIDIIYPGKNKAQIKLNSVNIERDFSGVYFADIPVRVTVKPYFDYYFVGWGKEAYGKDEEIIIKTDKDVMLQPKLMPKPHSPSRGKIVFNEIHFSQADASKGNDWVEIVNKSAQEMNLSNWFFKDQDDDHTFMLPENTTLKPREYLIIAQDPAQFITVYPDVDPARVVGGFDFGLSAEGDKIRLYSKDKLLVDSLTYRVDGQWAKQPEAEKHLALSDYKEDNSNPSAWLREKPTPGTDNYRFQQLEIERKEYEARIRFYQYLTTGAGALIVVSYFFWWYYKAKKAKITE